MSKTIEEILEEISREIESKYGRITDIEIEQRISSPEDIAEQLGLNDYRIVLSTTGKACEAVKMLYSSNKWSEIEEKINKAKKQMRTGEIIAGTSPLSSLPIAYAVRRVLESLTSLAHPVSTLAALGAYALAMYATGYVSAIKIDKAMEKLEELRKRTAELLLTMEYKAPNSNYKKELEKEYLKILE